MRLSVRQGDLSVTQWFDMDNKALVDTLAANLDSNRGQVAELLSAFVEIVGEQCSQLNSIAIPGFGSFEAKKKQERVTVHPSSGKRMLVPPKITMSFRPSALLKQKIKNS